jgi:hypothetical protein
LWVSADLVAEMLRAGFAVTDRVRCVAGLPENAMFVRSENVWKAGPVIALYFVSPDWPVVSDGEPIPMLDVLFHRETT